jgi:hypothetical protein
MDTSIDDTPAWDANESVAGEDDEDEEFNGSSGNRRTGPPASVALVYACDVSATCSHSFCS